MGARWPRARAADGGSRATRPQGRVRRAAARHPAPRRRPVDPGVSLAPSCRGRGPPVIGRGQIPRRLRRQAPGGTGRAARGTEGARPRRPGRDGGFQLLAAPRRAEGRLRGEMLRLAPRRRGPAAARAGVRATGVYDTTPGPPGGRPTPGAPTLSGGGYSPTGKVRDPARVPSPVALQAGRITVGRRRRARRRSRTTGGGRPVIREDTAVRPRPRHAIARRLRCARVRCRMDPEPPFGPPCSASATRPPS